MFSIHRRFTFVITVETHDTKSIRSVLGFCLQSVVSLDTNFHWFGFDF